MNDGMEYERRNGARRRIVARPLPDGRSHAGVPPRSPIVKGMHVRVISVISGSMWSVHVVPCNRLRKRSGRTCDAGSEKCAVSVRLSASELRVRARSRVARSRAGINVTLYKPIVARRRLGTVTSVYNLPGPRSLLRTIRSCTRPPGTRERDAPYGRFVPVQAPKSPET